MKSTHSNPAKIIGILLGVIVVILAAVRLTRGVPPFTPPTDRALTAWGTMDEATAHNLQAILDNEVNAQKTLGFQVYIRTPDGKTWSGTSGTTDLARKIPMQRNDVIRIGSTTKTFTAVLVLKLVEEGQLNLDDPLAKWFPDIPEAETITVKHLLNHSSGLAEIIPKGMMKSIISSTYWKRDELLQLIAQDKPAFEPGSAFAYSNSNYILLGYIVEDVTGKTIVQRLHEQIIDPLNLEHTFFIPYEPAPANLVTGYDRDLAHFPGLLDIQPDNVSWATLAFTSGALASTAEDVGIFFDALFTNELLDQVSLDEMTTFIPAENPGFEVQTGSGLGLMRLEIDGHELYGHVGQFMGSESIAMYEPTQNYLIVIASNLSNLEMAEVLAKLQCAILEP